MNQFKITSVPYFSQRDNQYDPMVSCFPTSMAMAMTYCLTTKALDKISLGCQQQMQLEDYINEIIYDDKTTAHLKETKSKNWWGWLYKRRTIFEIEEYVFNRLMRPFGFFATVFENMPYDKFCATIAMIQLPIILSGDFRSVSTVKGHIVCAIGFNKIGLEEIIVNDPYGNAYKKYDPTAAKEGNGIAYSTRFFKKDAEGNMTGLLIEKVK